MPSTLELEEPITNGESGTSVEQANVTVNNGGGHGCDSNSLDNQNIEIIGTHLLVPQNSISKMVVNTIHLTLKENNLNRRIYFLNV